METTVLAQFYVIGISIRTTNENGQSAIDIPALWGKFLSENIAEKIPNKTDYNIYCIYTDYEEDFKKPYTTILGCKVDHLNNIPEGFTGKTIDGGNYVKFVAKGKLTDPIVFQEWTKIWESGMKRAYKADFEIYDHRAQHPEMAEVDIFIS